MEPYQFHAVVTDPPYGLGKEPDVAQVMASWVRCGHHEVGGGGFMGKKWDAFVPQPTTWKECVKVMKPGAHMVCFAGTRTLDWMTMALRFVGLECRDLVMWVHSQGFPKGINVSKVIDKKSGDKQIAERWEGWNTALKPSVEPIILARKPISGTVADCVVTHETGAINVDACRVGDIDNLGLKTGHNIKSSGTGIYCFNRRGTGLAAMNGDFVQRQVKGRWPANVLHDGSDEVLKLFPESYSHGESGSAARFFYTTKADDSDRPHGEGTVLHLTVKPIDLMQYLIRLVCVKGGVVLDPFMGSGSTGCAAILEGVRFVGIEQSKEYADIAVGRLNLALIQRKVTGAPSA